MFKVLKIKNAFLGVFYPVLSVNCRLLIFHFFIFPEIF
jgi:hypothetical protein